MSQDQGFIDLRLNRQEGQINESFWPSFTDIMTVIVMIFLIAMVVLLMRNMELVDELRSTMEAERVASELARATGEEKQTLSTQLMSSQEQTSELQLQLMKLRERSVTQQTELAGQLKLIADLTGERDRLEREKAQMALLQQSLETDLEAGTYKLESAERRIVSLSNNVGGLEQNLQNLQTRFSDAQTEVSRLQENLSQQALEVEQARRDRAEFDRKYLVLTGDYDDLKVRYDKLVKPARSTNGRRLVEVKYWKTGKVFRISYRFDGDGPFAPINRARLDRRLEKLRDAEQNGLYVKVIFPENSGLSYNEAWGFTSHLHQNYDYYYQEQVEPEEDTAADGRAPDTSSVPNAPETE